MTDQSKKNTMTVVDTSTNIASHHPTKGSLPTTPTKEKKATSTGHHPNHYWSLLVTSTTSPSDQYCSDHRPVLVVFTTL